MTTRENTPHSSLPSDATQLLKEIDHLHNRMRAAFCDDWAAQLDSIRQQVQAAAASSQGCQEKYEALSAKYNELLLEVAHKHPNETRHETARRYIREREAPSADQSACKSTGSSQRQEPT